MTTTLVANNAFSTLASSITATQTTIVLSPGTGVYFPQPNAGQYFWATMVNSVNAIEVVKVTGVTGDTLTVVRGQDKTTANGYSAGDRFELRPCAALFNDKLGVADAASTYVTQAYANLNYLNLTGNSQIDGSLSLKAVQPQLQLLDTSDGPGGGAYRIISASNDLFIQRSTDTTQTFSTLSTPLYFANDQAVFSKRPTWAGVTPFDTGNFNPASYAPISGASFEGWIGSTSAAQNNLSVANQGGYMGWNENGQGMVSIICNRGLGLGGFIFRTINAGNTEQFGYTSIDGNGNISTNSGQVWTTGTLQNVSQLNNNMGYVTSIPPVSIGPTISQGSGTLSGAFLQQYGNGVQLVLQYSGGSSGGGGSSGSGSSGGGDGGDGGAD